LATFDRSARWTARLVAVAALALATGGCTDLDLALGKIPVFSTIRNAPSFEPYTAPRNPPANTVPFESPLGAPLEPPLAPTDPALREFGEKTKNPFPMSEEVLAAGQAAYHTYCYACHGDQGQGNGPVVGPDRYPFAPSLVTAPATTRSDGYVYGIIRVGRGLMPAYGGRIAHDDRWFIVNYVRHLQQQASSGAAQTPPAAAQGRE
jgi:mono/diheme cytochrome c family protein